MSKKFEEMSREERMKSLFPVAYAPSSLVPEQPQMSDVTNNSNNIAALGWKTVASKGLAIATAVFAPLDKFTTDYSESIVAFPSGASVTTTIEIAKSVGEAIKNATDWNVTAVKTEAVKIEINRYSRPFLITTAEMAQGSKIEGKLTVAIETVVKTIMDDLHTQIKEANPSVIGGLTVDKFTPEYVATDLSGLIIPEVTALIVSPTYLARLTPYNADSLKLENGVYGIGGIYKATGLDKLAEDGKSVGYMGYSNAIGIISRQPLMNPLPNGAIFVSQLGSVGGISLYLKQWSSPGVEGIWHSVEAAVGSVVAVPQNLRILSAGDPA